jgi:hypothetical protein
LLFVSSLSSTGLIVLLGPTKFWKIGEWITENSVNYCTTND